MSTARDSFDITPLEQVCLIPPAWTDAAPTVEGVYWMRQSNADDGGYFAAIPVEVTDSAYGLGYLIFGHRELMRLPAGALWCGPLEPLEGEDGG